MSAAIRRLGSGRLEVAAVPACTEWVAVPGPFGEELAVVVADESRCRGWTGTVLVARALTDQERERIVTLWQRIAAAARVLRGHVPGPVVGVRATLAGVLILELGGLTDEDPSTLERTLTAATGHPVRVVPVHRPAVYGGIGRLWSSGEVLPRAVERLVAGGPAFPGGYPRIGARVTLSNGSGIVVSVRTRDRTVLVRLGDETVRLPVDDLRWDVG
ncbi:MAG: hypothetical protein RMH81_01815 [Thermomicrobium sp.]|nr:hypothetical protein [Thermomicrobium sp.]